jgi:hypothetical protein
MPCEFQRTPVRWKDCHRRETKTLFFCLAESDALIADVSIATDRLLIPLKSDQHRDDVHLVMKVKTQLVSTMGLYSFDFAALS